MRNASTQTLLSEVFKRAPIELERAVNAGRLRRVQRRDERGVGLESDGVEDLRLYNMYYDQIVDSLTRRASRGESAFAGHLATLFTPVRKMSEGGRFFVRNPALRGPMSVFGYNYLSDKLGAERVSKLRLLEYRGVRGTGGDYAYEILNHARYPLRAVDIRNAVAAIYGPVSLDLVLEYLLALKEAGVVTERPQ